PDVDEPELGVRGADEVGATRPRRPTGCGRRSPARRVLHHGERGATTRAGARDHSGAAGGRISGAATGASASAGARTGCMDDVGGDDGGARNHVHGRRAPSLSRAPTTAPFSA